jgi:hypothetical protein
MKPPIDFLIRKEHNTEPLYYVNGSHIQRAATPRSSECDPRSYRPVAARGNQMLHAYALVLGETNSFADEPAPLAILCLTNPTADICRRSDALPVNGRGLGFGIDDALDCGSSVCRLAVREGRQHPDGSAEVQGLASNHPALKRTRP